MEFAAGIDFGGTSAKIGLIGRDGSILAKDALPVDPGQGFEEILEPVARRLASFRSQRSDKDRLSTSGSGRRASSKDTEGTWSAAARTSPPCGGNRSRRSLKARLASPRSPKTMPPARQPESSHSGREEAFQLRPHHAGNGHRRRAGAGRQGLPRVARLCRRGRPPLRRSRRSPVQLRQQGLLRAVCLRHGHCPGVQGEASQARMR